MFRKIVTAKLWYLMILVHMVIFTDTLDMKSNPWIFKYLFKSKIIINQTNGQFFYATLALAP